MSDEPPTKSSGTTSSPSRKVWEYEILYLASYLPERKAQLKQLGSEGWEMVGVDGTTFYFKREKLG